VNRKVRLLVAGVLAIAAVTVAFGLRPAANESTGVDRAFDPDIDLDDADSTALPSQEAFATHVAPFLARYCADCHSGDRPKGEVALAFSTAASIADSKLLLKVAGAIRSGRMPPRGRSRPEPAESDAFLAWVDRESARLAGPNRVTLRRLNRAEYNNTIRDLVGVAFNPAADFPADDTGDGFDTNADVLSISPLLIEKYVVAAESIVDAASADQQLWQRVRTPPAEDYIPFVLRGTPPLRDKAAKVLRGEAVDDQAARRAAEIDRTYYAIQTFADRAYRRPVAHAEVQRLMRFVESAMSNGDDADAGLKLALNAILVSPHFLFRLELDSPGPDRERSLTDFELATRLSYFLWSSMPDDELFRLAANNKLHEPRTLAAQVRRLLADPKSRALAENFAGQWLQTRALPEVARDPARFPDFDADLRNAMREETELFFDHIVRADRGVIELLTADYTFVNERLARHYGIANVTGAEFRQVNLAGTGRTGVLTHASVLTVNSGPTRTSPVKRGKWVLENVLGVAQPPPPPGADTLVRDDGTAMTFREQLAKHRSRSECASCHARLDPLGFGLENFDAIGKWRDRDGSGVIDAAGTLPDGRAFNGPGELAAAIAERPSEFARCLTEKLLTYALGRSLGRGDREAVARIVRHAARNEYRFSSLVIALVRGDPFQKQFIHAEGMR
jgi:hypothetical protein